MYKLVAIDLDGTLLNNNGEISEENFNEIKKALEKGIYIVLSSGRVSSSVKGFSDVLGIDDYLISSNGALVYDIKNNENICERFISKKKVLEIINICEENSIFYNIHTFDSVITKTLEYNTLFYHYENKRKNSREKININIVENIPKYIEESNINEYLKITIADSDTSIFMSIVKKIKEIKDIDVLEVEHISKKTIIDGTQKLDIRYNYTEITSKNVNKWTAIKYLIEKLNIPKEEVIAIGDNINDIEMIQNAGLGVAMDNSACSIKEAADVVTKSNNESGVAYIFKTYLN